MDWLLDLLRAGLLSVHLVSNALAGGSPLAASLLLGKEEDRRRLAWFGAWALVLGLLSGGLCVLLILAGGAPGYADAASRLPGGAYGMLAAEWAFTAVLYGVYLLGWDRLSKRRVWHALIAVIAATNLLYHFPTLMVVLGRLASDPAAATADVVTRRVVVRLFLTPHALGQTIHFWALGAAVTGAAGMRLASLQRSCRLIALAGVLALLLSGSCLAWSTDAARTMFTFSAAGWLMLGGVTCGLLALSRLCREIADHVNPSYRFQGLLGLAVGLMALSASILH